MTASLILPTPYPRECCDESTEVVWGDLPPSAMPVKTNTTYCDAEVSWRRLNNLLHKNGLTSFSHGDVSVSNVWLAGSNGNCYVFADVSKGTMRTGVRFEVWLGQSKGNHSINVKAVRNIRFKEGSRFVKTIGWILVRSNNSLYKHLRKQLQAALDDAFIELTKKFQKTVAVKGMTIHMQVGDVSAVEVNSSKDALGLRLRLEQHGLSIKL